MLDGVCTAGAAAIKDRSSKKNLPEDFRHTDTSFPPSNHQTRRKKTKPKTLFKSLLAEWGNNEPSIAGAPTITCSRGDFQLFALLCAAVSHPFFFLAKTHFLPIFVKSAYLEVYLHRSRLSGGAKCSFNNSHPPAKTTALLAHPPQSCKRPHTGTKLPVLPNPARFHQTQPGSRAGRGVFSP